ncbi:MAG TPA: septum formation initiator family protein [Oligoflexia bacterium]|nr:septum formation initiator family protein [Oligoflexia bacterium]
MIANRKFRIVVLVLFCWSVWISGLFGNDGILQAYRLSKVRRDLTLRIRALENERSRLDILLSDLYRDDFAQEMAIRDTLGYVREGEVVFETR